MPQTFLSDHLLFSDFAPEAVSLKITQAPAEFVVPVKQDRCAARRGKGALTL